MDVWDLDACRRPYWLDLSMHTFGCSLPCVIQQADDMEGHYASGDKGKVGKKDASKWNESGNGWERGDGEAVREERVGRRHERSEEGEREREEDDGFRESGRSGVCLNACVFVFDKPGSQADCTSRHVPRSCRVARLLGQSKQPIKGMGQQEKWGPGSYNVLCTKREPCMH